MPFMGREYEQFSVERIKQHLESLRALDIDSNEWKSERARFELFSVDYVASLLAEIARLQRERAETVTMLHTVCEAYGDNEWPDTLHLADVVQKHLMRPLDSWAWKAQQEDLGIDNA